VVIGVDILAISERIRTEYDAGDATVRTWQALAEWIWGLGIPEVLEHEVVVTPALGTLALGLGTITPTLGVRRLGRLLVEPVSSAVLRTADYAGLRLTPYRGHVPLSARCGRVDWSVVCQPQDLDEMIPLAVRMAIRYPGPGVRVG